MAARESWSALCARLAEERRQRDERWQAETAKGYPNVMCFHVERGNLKKLRQMLRWASTNVNAHEDGWTPLMHAAFVGRPAVCRLLLKAGADPSLTAEHVHANGSCDTALTLAVREGHELCLEELLAGGAERDQLCDTVCALQVAVMYGEVGSAKRLIAAGSDINMVHKTTQRTLLHGACTAAGNVKCLEFLLDAQADVNARDGEERTALTLACGLANDEAMVRLLLSRGADTSCVDRGGGRPMNALTLAVIYQAIGCVHALLEHGVNVEESPDCNPLAYALVVGSLPGVQALRAYGARLGRLGERLATEGPRAHCEKPMREVVERWLATTLDYASPLCYAATGILSQRAAIALLRAGADPLARKHATAPSPLQLAQASAHAADPSSAAFAILRAARWTPASHHAFPKAARARAVELLLLGQRVVCAKHLFLDLWLHIMGFAVEAVEPPLRLHPSCQPQPQQLDGAVPLLAALLARGASDRPLSRCPILQRHLDVAAARLDELDDGARRAPAFLAGPRGALLFGPFRARYSGADLRPLSPDEQAAPLAAGTARILCVGSDEYYENGQRLRAEWEAPRLASARRVLALLTLANGHVLGYALEVISDVRFFFPTPPGLLAVQHPCLSRLSLFDLDGTILLDQPHLMRHAEGEIYGNDAWWLVRNGDDEWSISMKCRANRSASVDDFLAAAPGVALDMHYY